MDKFDIVIIGGGVAGLVAASGAAQLGARVALIDKNGLGGDCLRSGCVPTKRLVRSASVASLARKAAAFGVLTGEVRVDFASVMAGVRAAQAEIGRRDSPERFQEMGVEVVFGNGRFVSPDAFEVDGKRYSGRVFLIATGSSPVMPFIPGLRDAGAQTNEGILEVGALPSSLAVLGAGPIGIEFGQAFGRLGSRVTVVEKAGSILPREDAELAAMLKSILEDEGMTIDVSTGIKGVRVVSGQKVMEGISGGNEKLYNTEEILAAVGRGPNVDGLDLQQAGVEYDRGGIKTDSRLRTSARHIFAAGDCAGGPAFTHVAEYQAGVALANALFPFALRSVDYTVVPRVTFTDPELAAVGLTEAEARERHGSVRVYRYDFKDVDRAVIDGNAKGMVKVVCGRRERILGAHILGPHAGELIHEYALAMRAGIPATEISKTIHAYPTLAQSVKRACDEHYRKRLFSGRFKRAAQWFIRRSGD
ncbi:MAG: FAD-dependent oxidoreductase [Deltaproteobacteria bacterium]|nr:FAD-dependent oxidoreductase [Deltaproteobacteria bacterium]